MGLPKNLMEGYQRFLLNRYRPAKEDYLQLLDNSEVMEDDIAEYGNARAFELGAIRVSLAQLASFPLIREREERGALALHGLHFDIGSGQLVGLDQTTGRFGGLPLSGEADLKPSPLAL